MESMLKADLIIKDCCVLTPEFEVKENQSIAIKDKVIIDMDNEATIDNKYAASERLSGKGKLAMPGLIDAHMHTCQQLLRGRITDELPMIWTRIMVPYESNLTEADVHISAQLSCLEMIKSGTTMFVDAGGTYMHKVAETVIESGLRGTITCSTMNTGNGIPSSMKADSSELLRINQDLYDNFHGSGDGRVSVWFSLRSILTCTADLITKVFETARECKTGVHAHMNEYPNEVNYCLENYKARPLEYLKSLGVLGSNFLSAHSILLSENEMDVLKQYDVKVVHCPISNSGKGIAKLPSLMQKGVTIGLGTDGAAHSGLSLFDQMKVLKSIMRACWGVPIFDPVIMPSKKIVEMATLGGAAVVGRQNELGCLEISKKADLILLNIDQPHIQPTHNFVNTLVESVNSHDVVDMIVDGKILMKNREVLTLDEDKIKYESKQAMKKITVRAGI